MSQSTTSYSFLQYIISNHWNLLNNFNLNCYIFVWLLYKVYSYSYNLFLLGFCFKKGGFCNFVIISFLIFALSLITAGLNLELVGLVCSTEWLTLIVYPYTIPLEQRCDELSDWEWQVRAKKGEKTDSSCEKERVQEQIDVYR